jgi:putative transposase
MAIPARHASPASILSHARTFFVTSSTWEKRNLSQSDRAAELFLKTLYEYRSQGKFKLHEFVVMPYHFHLLLTVGGDMTVERAVQFVKGGFAFRAGKELGIRAPFWQKGFSEVRVLDTEHYTHTREYIRDNPVKTGLAVRAEDYLYSSARPGLELDSPPQGLKPVVLRVRDDRAEALS